MFCKPVHLPWHPNLGLTKAWTVFFGFLLLRMQKRPRGSSPQGKKHLHPETGLQVLSSRHENMSTHHTPVPSHKGRPGTSVPVEKHALVTENSKLESANVLSRTRLSMLSSKIAFDPLWNVLSCISGAVNQHRIRKNVTYGVIYGVTYGVEQTGFPR